MIHTEACGEKLSMLGFGTMRLPVDEAGKIIEAQVAEMTEYALSHGVNYFDTAYPYHGGESERVMGRVLEKYPRESFLLATKYPGHQLSERYDPAATFEEQLQKCGVEYFDFYLLHNVCEMSIDTYLDPRWGIVDYFLEQKRLGRIRHLGFSSHGQPDNLRRFLEKYGKDMEFCQIQLNYMDWTLQEAKEKCDLLNAHNIPIWVMEPLRGGRLAALSPADMGRLRSAHPDWTAAAWAFRWIAGVPGVKLILSGMSNFVQMQQNVETFAAMQPLSAAEDALLLDIGEGMKNSVPCTGCRYCCDSCPMELDIPMMMNSLNEARFGAQMGIGMRMESLPADKQPTACLGCGACVEMCPQKIDIPSHMRELADILSKMPSWAETCRQREEAARRGREQAQK